MGSRISSKLTLAVKECTCYDGVHYDLMCSRWGGGGGLVIAHTRPVTAAYQPRTPTIAAYANLPTASVSLTLDPSDSSPKHS